MVPLPDTVPHWLLSRAERTPQQSAYWRRTAVGKWEATTWEEVAKRVRSLCGHLWRLGLRPGDRAVILMPTTPEWEYCHLATLTLGGVVVGIDDHDATKNIQHILHTVRPRALFLASGLKLDQLAELLLEPPALVVVADSATSGNVHSLAELLADRSQPEPAWPPVEPGQAATVIFTSGTTGQPKGIAYTHRQLCLAGEALVAHFSTIREDARLVCWLPLSNLFQRIINLCAMIRGAQSFFVESPGSIMGLLPEIRPALFIGVPRFYEKLYAGIETEIAKRPRSVRMAVRLGWRIGQRFHRVRRERRHPGFFLRAAHSLAERLVLRRLRLLMGSELQFMISGSAPLAPWLMEKFHGLGWLVLEAYGISENVVPIAANTPEAYRFGSVGRPLPENEIKLAEDGELLVRGKGVFEAYYGKTDGDEPLDEEGFLRTGDFAKLDEDGFLWLTGRKSEVFKTSTGRRIAPVPIEACLKQLPYVEQAVLFGRERPVPVALLSIDLNVLVGGPEEPILLSPALQRRIASDVDVACATLPAYQKVAGILVTRRAFGIAGGELTANLKLKRGVIEDKYRADIDGLYDALALSKDHSHCLVMESS